MATKQYRSFTQGDLAALSAPYLIAGPVSYAEENTGVVNEFFKKKKN